MEFLNFDFTYFQNIIDSYSYFIIFALMTIESSFIPFPSEIVMIPAGFLAAKAKISFTLAVIAGILGSIAGALINYYIAKSLGVRLLEKYGKYFLMPPERLKKMQAFFLTHGPISIFIGRLLPAIRQYISFPAGVSSMCMKKFLVFTALGSGIWMVILTTIGYIYGDNQALIHDNMKMVLISLLSSLTAILVSYYLIRRKKRAKVLVE